MESAAATDPAINTSILAPKQDDLKTSHTLRNFITTHCRIRHYSFQIKKCVTDKCTFGLC